MPGIEIQRADRIQILRFNRPGKKNALTAAMYAALADGLAAGEAASDVAVHVLFGSNGIFSAGNDIQDFLTTAQRNSDEAADPSPEVMRFIRALAELEKPLLAGVDGPAIGIGTTLLLHCDLVYASPRAQFSTPFLNLALVPEAASSLLMPARMGHVRAFDMLVMGTVFGAEDARHAGLINAIVPAHELEPVVLEAARALALKPASALAHARRLMRGDPAVLLERMDAEAAAFRAQLATPEAKAAFEAFLTKSRAKSPAKSEG